MFVGKQAIRFDERENTAFGALGLPVIIITTEETASAHVHIFLLLFLFLLLLLLLLSGSSGTSSGRGGSTSSGNGDKLLKSLLDHLLDVLSLEVGKELLNLLVLSFSTDGLKNALDVLSLLRNDENRAGYSGLLVSTEKEHEVGTKMSHLF